MPKALCIDNADDMHTLTVKDFNRDGTPAVVTGSTNGAIMPLSLAFIEAAAGTTAVRLLYNFCR